MKYEIIKTYSDSRPTRVVMTVDSLEDAQRICKDPSTSSISGTGRPIYVKSHHGTKKRVDWFYGYRQA